MQDEEIPVLIVGGSLVGLSTSLFLAWHGVPSLVVERHPDTAIHPRAGLFHQRTLEIYRTVGLEGEIVRKANEEFVQDGAIIAVDNLAGKELAYFLSSLNEGVRDVSPSTRMYCTQSVLEPILRKHAEQMGARTQFNTELISFECVDDDIQAVIKEIDNGKESIVRARYMVAADGNRSPVREQLGIPMHGHGTFAKSTTIYFRAGIRPILGDRPCSIIYVTNDKLKGFMRLFESSGLSGFLAVNVLMGPQGKVDDVADAHNIAWKLAFVLKGLAGPELLSTYEPERRPASTLAVEQAYTRYVKRMDPSLGDHDIQEEVDDLQIELGYCYHSSAICNHGYDVTDVHEHPRASKARPGTRAPHMFLEKNGKQISSLDLFGRNFVLLAGRDGHAWCQAARMVSWPGG